MLSEKLSSPVYKDYKYKLTPSLTDILLQRSRELLNSLERSSEDEQKEIELMTLYFFAISYNLEIVKQFQGLKSSNSFGEFVKDFFIKKATETIADTNPPIIELWATVNKIYSRNFPLVNNQSMNIEVDESSREKVGILIYSFIVFFHYGASHIALKIKNMPEEQPGVKEECYTTCKIIFNDIVNNIEEFELDDCFPSISLIDIFKAIIHTMVNHDIWNYSDLQIRLLKKTEDILKWSYTPEFSEKFQKSLNPSLLRQSISAFLTLTDESTINRRGFIRVKKEYRTTLSTFENLNMILANIDTSPVNDDVQKIQERIIRTYTAICLFSIVHLNEVDEDSADQKAYLDYERLQKIWEIIFRYSKFNKNLEIEFDFFNQILQKALEVEGVQSYLKVFSGEVIKNLYTTCYFNLDVDPQRGSITRLNNLLSKLMVHNRSEYDEILAHIFITIQSNFEAILAEGEEFQRYYENSEDVLLKKFLRTEASVVSFAHHLQNFFARHDLIIKDSPLNEVMAKYFPKFVFSPVFYMTGANCISYMPNIIIVFNSEDSLHKVLFGEYASKYVEALAVMSQKLTGPKPSELLERKLHAICNLTGDIHSFFNEFYQDDVREIHAINSKAVLIPFFDCLDIRETLASNTYPELTQNFTDTLRKNLPGITKYTIDIFKFLALKSANRNQQIPCGNLISMDLQSFSCFNDVPSFKEYFKDAIQEFLTRCARSDVVENNEDSFLFRLGSFQAFHFIMQNMISVNQHTMFESQEAAIHMMKIVFDFFIDFAGLLKKNFLHVSTSCLSLTTIQVQERQAILAEEDLKHIYKLIKNILPLPLDIASSLLDQEDDQTSPTLEALYQLVLNIDPELLSLCILDKQDAEKSALYDMMKRIFSCFLKALKHKEMKEPRAIQEDEPPSDAPAKKELKLKIFEQLLSRAIVFTSPMFKVSFIPNHYHQIVHKLTNQFIQGHTTFQEGLVKDSDVSESVDLTKFLRVKIYQSSLLNKLRNSTIMFSFVLNFIECHTTPDHQFYIETLDVLIKEIKSLLNQLDVQDLKNENTSFIVNDFAFVFQDFIASITSFSGSLLYYHLHSQEKKEELNQTLDMLCFVLKRWADISQLYDNIGYSIQDIFKNSVIMLLFYFRLQDNDILSKLVEDKQLIEMLIRHGSHEFYSIAELYVLQAFEPETMFRLKMRSLVYLDETGKRLWRSISIKDLEKYWSPTLIQIWKEDFTVENCMETGKNVIKLREGSGKYMYKLTP